MRWIIEFTCTIPSNHESNAESRTPIFVAGSYGEIVHLEHLRRRGANLQARDLFGRTLLHAAFDSGGHRPEPRGRIRATILWCRQHGIDPNIADQWGLRPIDCAHPLYQLFLLEGGDDVRLESPVLSTVISRYVGIRRQNIGRPF